MNLTPKEKELLVIANKKGRISMLDAIAVYKGGTYLKTTFERLVVLGYLKVLGNACFAPTKKEY